MQNWIIIIVSLIVFGLLIYALIETCPSNVNVNEGWIDYQDFPYGNVHSGAGNSNGIRPLVFYNNPIYRRPYNWPVCHLVDYPVPHCRSDSL
jgi:hypothetical protein